MIINIKLNFGAKTKDKIRQPINKQGALIIFLNVAPIPA